MCASGSSTTVYHCAQVNMGVRAYYDFRTKNNVFKFRLFTNKDKHNANQSRYTHGFTKENLYITTNQLTNNVA